MFVNEDTGKPICCPHCHQPLGDSPCSHLVLYWDPDNQQSGGPWSDHFDIWVTRLSKSVFDHARNNGNPPRLMRDSVKKLRRHYRGKVIPDDDAAEDAMWEVPDEMREIVECMMSRVDGLAEFFGVIDSGPWSSSSGTFYFASDPEKALHDVQQQIDALCTSPPTTPALSAGKRRK